MTRKREFKVLTYEPNHHKFVQNSLAPAVQDFDFYIICDDPSKRDDGGPNIHYISEEEASNGDFDVALLHITGDPIQDTNEKLNPYFHIRDNVLNSSVFMTMVHGRPLEMHRVYKELVHSQPLIFNSFGVSAFYEAQNKVVIYPWITPGVNPTPADDVTVERMQFREPDTLVDYLARYDLSREVNEGVPGVIVTSPLDDKWMFLTDGENSLSSEPIKKMTQEELRGIAEKQNDTVRSLFGIERYRVNWISLVNSFIGL